MKHGQVISGGAVGRTMGIDSDGLQSRRASLPSAMDAAAPSPPYESVTLACGQLWRRQVMAKESIIFICTHGELWLTMEGDQHDHLLGHVDRHVVAGPGKLVVQALIATNFTWQVQANPDNDES